MNKATGSTAATISQVAAKAGVSRSTVSRAFTNPKVLSEETVELVHEVAAACAICRTGSRGR